MSDQLNTEEEAGLVLEIGEAAALLAGMSDGLATEPPAAIDLAALQAALTRLPLIATRLKARGGLATRVKADKTLDGVYRMISEQMVPRLVHLLVTRTPVPGGPPVAGGDPTALDLAELYRVLTELLIRRDSRLPAIPMLKRGIHPLIDRTRAYVEAAEASMESPDFPDLGSIAANLLRLDVLTWVLVTAGFPRETVEIQLRTRKLARSAMRRATVVMNRCAATFALTDRINLAGTISEIDDLVLIFQRVRQGEREEMPDGEENFVESLGAGVITEFTKAVIELSRSIIETFIASAFEVSETRAGEIAGMLRALVKLRRLLTGVKDDGIAKSVEAMSDELKRGLQRIRQHILTSAERARAERSLAHLAELEVISEALTRLSHEIDGPA